ncbi:hypothetical protein LBMAG08_02810 [Actinomycetes bacterium]|nr:hypothetical protein LBMAG08_02810 [Actinomycetes bacterium]
MIHHIIARVPEEFEIIVVGANPLFSGAPQRYIQENPAGGGLVAGICAAK